MDDDGSVMLLTNVNAPPDDDDASKNTLNLSNNINNDSATEVNKNILIESENRGKLKFPVVVVDKTLSNNWYTSRMVKKVDPVSIVILKARLPTTLTKECLIEKYRIHNNKPCALTNRQLKIFPLKYWENKTPPLFPVKKVFAVKNDKNMLGKLKSKDDRSHQEVTEFPTVISKTTHATFPAEMGPHANILHSDNGLTITRLLPSLSKCRLTNLNTPNRNSIEAVSEGQRNFPIRNQQQSKYVAHFPCPDIKTNILNSSTDFNQNNPAANGQKQTAAQNYDVPPYTEIMSIDDNNSTPRIMTHCENTAGAKSGNVRIIQVHTKRPTSDQRRSNNGKCSAVCELNQEQQQFPNSDVALVLPASNTIPAQQSYQTEYHNFNIIRATSENSLLSGRNIKNEQLVCILKTTEAKTITPTIGESLEYFECEEQPPHHFSNNNKHNLDEHHLTDRQCSDDRDTSSQEVVLVKEIPAKPSETCPSVSTHRQQQSSSFFSPDSSPILDILPNFDSVLSQVERNGCNCAEVDIELIDVIKKSRQVNDETLNEQPKAEISEKCVHNCEQVEMTVTKLSEDSEESSILSDNQKIIIDETIDEMKFEMKSVKGALPSTTPVRTHLRNEQNISNTGSRSNSTTIGSTYGSSSGYSSVNLPRFGKASSEVSSSRPHGVAGGRAVSVDTVDSLLPASTRLRRQRRMLSQDPSTEDQAEDPIERLNRLRARISGALTEVKGVLKQYSTETEVEGQKTSVKAEQQPSSTMRTTRNTEIPPIADEEPVKFRFVRKVRRRSVFDEADEEKEKQVENVVNIGTEMEKIKDKTVNIEPEAEKQKDQTNETGLISSDELKNTQLNQEHKAVDKSQIYDANQFAENKELDKSVKELTKEVKSLSEIPNEVSKTDVAEVELNKTIEDNYQTRLQSSDIKTLDPVSEEKSSAHLEMSTDQTNSSNAEPPIEIVSKRDDDATGAVKKIKRKVATKIKDGVRRASIAAVEGSKIEPPIKSTIPLKIKTQRRPSDSEAIIKKKVATKNFTSGLEGEVTTPMVKTITKIKRLSVKSEGTAAVNVKKTQVVSKVNEKAASSTTTADKSDGDTTITDANNSNKDIVPIASKTTPTTTMKTAQSSAIMPTQLVIDDASLTIAQTTAAAAAPPNEDEATKHSRTATKSDEQNVDATLASQLRASKQNGGDQATIAKQLTELVVGETLTEVVAAVKEVQSRDLSNKDEDSTKGCETVEKIESKITSQVKSNQIPVAANQTKFTEIPETLTSAQVADDIKEPINQKIIPADSLQVHTIQQVAAVDVIPVPPPPQIEKSLSAVNATDAATSQTDDTSSVSIDEATKASSTSTTPNSTEQTTASVTSVATAKKEEERIQIEANTKMPELQVMQMPVKAVQVFGKHQPQEPAPFNVLHKDEFSKKKVILKKLVRKNSTEKPIVSSKSNEKSNTVVQATKDKSKTHPEDVVSNEIQLVLDDGSKQEQTVTDDHDDASATNIIDEIDAAEALEEAIVVVVEAPPKKPRTVKKKVIIKRQKRKLSISDTFFNAPEEDDQKQPPPEVETVEKAIAYVTDDEEEEPIEPPKPLKACIKQREYAVGDWVMYAERFKKTQVRWKKGRVMERITSISYKLDIDGKEVPAHISYIKKHTDRKVNFGGKEYLEIDYEQIAIEEQKARSYSIWNMV